MLELPSRGDGLARVGILLAAGLYLALALLLVESLVTSRAAAGVSVGASLAELIGRGETPNDVITALVVLGLIVTIGAGLYVLFFDVRRMRAEEDDISWVAAKQEAGLLYVLAPTDRRAAMFNDGQRVDLAAVRVETLIDDRVLRTHAALSRGEQPNISPEELRLIAETRTAAFGSTARYASSLLLLFAVLGTFAGVKTALPSLIQAVSTGSAGELDPAAIRGPLEAVAAAFGGNALALIGAIALGIVGQAITLGRRNLLERLELVSTQYVYRGGDSGVASSNPLVAAVQTLERTAKEIRGSNGNLMGIESGLQRLGAEFKTAFGALEERLASIADRHESDVYDKTAKVMIALQGRVAELAGAVHENAAVYRGLVDGLGTRAAESHEAVAQMRKSNEALDRALQGVTRTSDLAVASFDRLDAAAAKLGTSTEEVKTQVAALTTAVAESMPTLRHMDVVMETALTRMGEVDKRAAQTWQATGDEVRRAMGTVTEAAARVAAPPPPAPPAFPPEALALLRRTADGVAALGNLPAAGGALPAPRRTTAQRALFWVGVTLLPALGVLLGTVGAHYLLPR
jgi:hypothetical protein